jgi:branched-chain amino acid transport system permease protein
MELEHAQLLTALGIVQCEGLLMMEMIIINGLVLGGAYSMLTIGFALVFGVARILNMAHTVFYMITGFLMYVAATQKLPSVPSAIIFIFVIGIFGMVCYRLLFDRVKEHQNVVTIIGIALVILFQEIFFMAFGGQYRGVKAFVTGTVEISGVIITYQQILVMGASGAMLVFVWLLLGKTRLGLSIRCASQDNEIANIVGVNVRRISMITVGVSAALAGIAGVAVAPIFMVSPAMWAEPLITTLAAVVLGGLGSIKGAIVATFILGFTETMVVFLIPGGSFLRGAASMAIMITVLIVRPQGLFGIIFEEETL